MGYSKLKQIAIRPENYRKLKSLGAMGESFDDVITKLLRKVVIESD